MPQTQREDQSPPGGSLRHYDAVVVGAGFAGLCQLYHLRRMGLSVRVLEAADDVGGTWYWNCYPGARVDAPSLQYSLSFSPELEQEWSWPEEYSAQPDLLRYVNHLVERFDLRRDISFATTVTAATYDEGAGHWLIATGGGRQFTARYFITAAGCLSAVNVPAFPGLDRFEGECHHTARYPRDGVDLRGKRVGVIGTGSTGIQVVTAVAAEAEHLYVFQRTPHYSMPAQNKPMDAERERTWKADYPAHRQAARHSPLGAVVEGNDISALSVSAEERERIFEEGWRRGGFNFGFSFNDLSTNAEANETAADFVRAKIRSIVTDPVTAEALSPRGYPIFTKRPCYDTGYYEQFNRDNVTLVDVLSDPIVEITPGGLRTTAADYDLDVIIFATGFDALTGPLLRMNIVGRDGQKLADKWQAGPRTFLGVMTSGFPNLFSITGPGSPSVLSNMTTSIEQHVEWICNLITHLEAEGITIVDADIQAEDDWVAHVNEIANRTLHFRANSWYLGANIPGKPRVFIPYAGGVGPYREVCEKVASDGYPGLVFERRAVAASVTTA